MVIGKKTDFHEFISSISTIGDRHLGILLGQSECRVAVSRQNADFDIRYFELNKFDTSAITENFGALGKDFKSVDIYSSDREVTLIPDGLFSAEYSTELISGVYGSSRRTEAHSFIEALQMYSLFRIDKDQLEALHQCFPQMRIHHLIDTVLMQSWVSLSFDSSYLFRLHLEENILFLCAFRGKDLMLFNTQLVKEATDIVYHALNSIQSCKIDHVSACISCSGDMNPGSHGYELLRSYCPNSEFLEPNHENTAPRDFILDNHRFCEL